MINSTPQPLPSFNQRSCSLHSIHPLHRYARAATVMLMLSPVFATAKGGRLQLLQEIVFAPEPIESWSRLYHCVFTAAEFKARKIRTLVDAASFGSTAAVETAAATASAMPGPQPAPVPPPALQATGIPILAQMLPQIADFTIVRQAGNDGANSTSTIASARSVSRTLVPLTVKDGPSNRPAVSRQAVEATPSTEADDSVTDVPIASYPVSKAILADIEARKSKLGLPLSAAASATAGPDRSARASRRPDLDPRQASAVDSLPRGPSVGKPSKNDFVDKQTGY